METENMSRVRDSLLDIQNLLLTREPFYEILQKFKAISNNDARVEFIGKILEKHPDILPQVIPSVKTMETSLEYRKKGNLFYVKNDVVKAIEFYNKALLHAPPDSVDLAYCYGNRSAALFQMKNYGDCLKDISRALEFCTDQNLKEKLLQRRRACEKIYQPIGRDEVKERIRRRMFDLPSRVNPLVPCFSADLQIGLGPKYGRHILAAANIHPGDVLAAENTNMIYPFKEHYQRICYACYKKNDAMIPCGSCNYVMFCNEECRLKSWNAIHKVECCIMHLLMNNKLQKLSYVLQAVVSARCSHDSWKDFMAAIKNEEEKWTNADDSNVAPNESQLYAFLFLLETNDGKLESESMLLRSLHSALLLHYLEKHTRFFSEFSKTTDLIDSIDMDPPIRKKYILFTGGVLLRYCVNFYCSTFAIRSHTTVDNCNWAQAAYPFSVFFNHSCAPNAFWAFNGLTLVIKALRPIKKGQQIFISYKYTYSDHSYEMRQNELQSGYRFKCECEACTNRWPILSDIRNNKYNINLHMSMVSILQTFLTDFPKEEYLMSILDGLYKRALALEEFAPSLEFVINGKCISDCWKLFRDEKYL